MINAFFEWITHSKQKYQEFISLFLCGMLIFFTIFVKGIPLVTVINEQIGGDKFAPSSKAIVLQGTIFVIRSVVKFSTMNYGCALSDRIGRKPIVVLFLLPNLLLDCLLLFGNMNALLLYVVGGLWGVSSITVPTLRAWLCDHMPNPVDAIAAQGAFRGFTIGLATVIGIPLGTILVLTDYAKYAFLFSLLANVIAIWVTCATNLKDSRSVFNKKDKEDSSRIIEMMDVDDNSDSGQLVLSSSSESDSAGGETDSGGVRRDGEARQSGLLHFLWIHSPLAGFHVIFEKNREIAYLWLTLFLSFCANETFIHTLFNYLLVGGGFTALEASMGFMLAGVSYIVVVENMLLYIGGVKANLVGLIITIFISLFVSLSSFSAPVALIGGWVFMVLLPFDPSHAGINGMLSKQYDHSRHGEVQGVIEQLSTLGVIGGYPGTLLFGYFISEDAPFYWPGVPFACAVVYAGVAAVIFYFQIYKQSDGKHKYPRIGVNSEENNLESH